LFSEYFPTQPVVATEWKKASGTAHTIRFAQQFERLNVSVHLNGAKTKADAGVAQIDLSLPGEHDRLMQVLGSSLRQRLVASGSAAMASRMRSDEG